MNVLDRLEEDDRVDVLVELLHEAAALRFAVRNGLADVLLDALVG